MNEPQGLPPDEAPPPVKVPLAIEDWLAVLIMAALVLITFANVLVRYFSNQSFAWTEEISVFLMIVMTLVGGCAAVARDMHIKIEYLLDVGSSQRRRRLRRFGALCTAGFFLLLAGLSVRMVWDEFRYDETTPAIGLPAWWFSVWLPLLSLAIAGRAFGLYRRLRPTEA
ncbi:MAG: TRAP transporter small permease [Aquincola tertiaricarbonis]|uniref:TRAP transporter small permease n=1 Tax=Aquincola TaxID=391952 RepID=UPI000614D23A|nr:MULTISPECIES: TRAP transporter small permease [Aquincola]MCR5866544.1 TRAP transporter small permease [Aquincola sp. J276]